MHRVQQNVFCHFRWGPKKKVSCPQRFTSINGESRLFHKNLRPEQWCVFPLGEKACCCSWRWFADGGGSLPLMISKKHSKCVEISISFPTDATWWENDNERLFTTAEFQHALSGWFPKKIYSHLLLPKLNCTLLFHFYSRNLEPWDFGIQCLRNAFSNLKISNVRFIPSCSWQAGKSCWCSSSLDRLWTRGTTVTGEF